MYDESKSLSRSLSAIVPLLITSTIPLFTIPFVNLGSSSCSQIATRYPLFTSFSMYGFTLL